MGKELSIESYLREAFPPLMLQSLFCKIKEPYTQIKTKPERVCDKF